ncbi:MAG: hypothetical protein HUJ25_12425 [Crocinitomicaceae bacterium]|nr:hypothetical protein [Crocinitomicaceae bacterium]
MEIERKQMSELIFHWIKSNGELHYVLRDVQIKLLFDRLVLRLTFDELAKVFRSTPGKIRQIFEALLMRIERYMSRELGELLRAYSNHLDKKPGSKQHGFEFSRIFLN